MEIQYKDIPEQEIVNLIAWYARKKGKEVVIHAGDGDVTVRFDKKSETVKGKDEQVIELTAAIFLQSCV